jgi:hypothetical protein
MDKIMRAFRVYEDYEDYLIVYLPEEINLFSVGQTNGFCL